VKGAHFAEEAAHALAYTTNPGFGGDQVFRVDVPDTHKVTHADTLEDLAKAYLEAKQVVDGDEFSYADYAPDPHNYGYFDDYDEDDEDDDEDEWNPTEHDAVLALVEDWTARGLTFVFQVIEEAGDVLETMEDSGHDWISFPDNYPEGTTTWRRLRDADPLSAHKVANLANDRAELHWGQPRDRATFERAGDWLAAAELATEPMRKGMRLLLKGTVKQHMRRTKGGKVAVVHEHQRKGEPKGAAPLPEDVTDAIESAMDLDGFTVLDAAMADHDDLADEVSEAGVGRSALEAAWRARGGNTDPLPEGFTERGGFYLLRSDPGDEDWYIFRATTPGSMELHAEDSAFAGDDLGSMRFYWHWNRYQDGRIVAFPQPKGIVDVDGADSVAALIATDERPAKWWLQRWEDGDVPTQVGELTPHDNQVLPALRAAGINAIRFQEVSGTTVQYTGQSPIQGKMVAYMVPGQEQDEDIAFDTLEEMWG